MRFILDLENKRVNLTSTVGPAEKNRSGQSSSWTRNRRNTARFSRTRQMLALWSVGGHWWYYSEQRYRRDVCKLLTPTTADEATATLSVVYFWSKEVLFCRTVMFTDVWRHAAGTRWCSWITPEVPLFGLFTFQTIAHWLLWAGGRAEKVRSEEE